MIRYFVLALWFVSCKLQAEVKAEWSQKEPRPYITINVMEALSPQQRKLLYSGFSTFSHLEIRVHREGSERSIVFVSECTIKYDLWEEKFDLLHFLEFKKEQNLQSFRQYAQLCLNAEIKSPSNINKLTQEQAKIEVRLEIAQVSNEFAKDVRTWLIQQQSGMMRGLFSHMLGDLKLSETVQIIVQGPSPQIPSKLQLPEDTVRTGSHD